MSGDHVSYGRTPTVATEPPKLKRRAIPFLPIPAGEPTTLILLEAKVCQLVTHFDKAENRTRFCTAADTMYGCWCEECESKRQWAGYILAEKQGLGRRVGIWSITPGCATGCPPLTVEGVSLLGAKLVVKRQGKSMRCPMIVSVFELSYRKLEPRLHWDMMTHIREVYFAPNNESRRAMGKGMR
jgi:hypothetical protein